MPRAYESPVINTCLSHWQKNFLLLPIFTEKAVAQNLTYFMYSCNLNL